MSGDPHDVLPRNRQALMRRLVAYADYNRNAPEGARLAGLQLDIEPYLLPGYALSPERWRQQYLEMAVAARATLDKTLPLDLVVPVWWGAHPQWGPQFLDPLAAQDISLTVMNYRTEANALREGAQPFLEWASRTQRPVRIAVESGPLPDETQRHFRAAQGGGDLWLVQLAGQHVLVLLARPMRGLPGRAFAYSHAVPIAATRYTFAGDTARMDAALAEAVPLWAAWPGFAGIAMHGLDAQR